jgi:hypothetical protein
MKLLITTLTMIFISFGANANRDFQKYNMTMLQVNLIQCMKAKANSMKTFYSSKNGDFYSYNGYVYNLSSFKMSDTQASGFCERTKNKIF